MKHSIRNWHTWLGVGLGIPLLLVGLTTFFIAHEKALGSKEIMLPASWFGSLAHEEAEPRSLLRHGSQTLLGAKTGLYQLAQGTASRLPGSPEDEIRAILPQDDILLLAGKKGLWRYQDGQSQRLLKDDCWAIARNAEGLIAHCKKAGLLASDDGHTWQPQTLAFAAEERNAQGVPLSKIIMDIHTGKLFFGKAGEWIWIDALGAVMVVFALTGLLLWARGRRQRAELG